MGDLSRILITLKRKKGKALVLFFIMTIIGTLISIAITINTAVQQTENKFWLQVPRLVVPTFDWEAYLLSGGTRDTLTPEILKQIGKLPQIDSFNFFIRAEVEIEGAILYQHASGALAEFYESHFRRNGKIVHALGMNNFQIPEFETGLLTLSEGRMLASGDRQHVLISKEFANLNHLSVGSELDVTIPRSSSESLLPEKDWAPLEVFGIEVVGIFYLEEGFSSQHPLFDIHRREQILNQMFIPWDFAETLYRQMMEYLFMTEDDLMEESLGWEYYRNLWLEEHSSFLLNDIRELDAFRLQAIEILPDFWGIRDFSTIMFPQMLAVMGNMSELMDWILLGAISSGLLIIILLIFFYLKEIKGELGIFLSLGESKWKILKRLLGELLLISMGALTLSLFIGQISAQSVSHQMLLNDLQQAGGNELALMEIESICIGCGGNSFRFHNPGDMSVEELLAAYEISMDFTTIVSLYAIGIGVIVLSTGIASTYLWMLPTKEILLG
ncbi:MAG: FtsX-like permease family protein [Turicibacter sp.]|nr:FtsX-like permease family protein [Turicibacter sp.]